MARTFAWILGGLFTSFGVLSLLFSFGAPWGDIATGLDHAGFDAMGDVATTARFGVAAICIAIGLPILVGLNATAWKQTDGY
jgi:hypothetical protein